MNGKFYKKSFYGSHKYYIFYVNSVRNPTSKLFYIKNQTRPICFDILSRDPECLHDVREQTFLLSLYAVQRGMILYGDNNILTVPSGGDDYIFCFVENKNMQMLARAAYTIIPTSILNKIFKFYGAPNE